jgi:hypothetical protein
MMLSRKVLLAVFCASALTPIQAQSGALSGINIKPAISQESLVIQVEIVRPKANQLGPGKAVTNQQQRPRRNKPASLNRRDREPGAADTMIGRVDGNQPGASVGGDGIGNQIMMGIMQGVISGVTNGVANHIENGGQRTFRSNPGNSARGSGAAGRNGSGRRNSADQVQKPVCGSGMYGPRVDTPFPRSGRDC